MKNIKQSPRLWILFGLSFCFAVVLVVELFVIQVLAGEQYAQRAADQYVRPNYHHFNRGQVLMQNQTGELVPLATTQSGYLATVNPQNIDEPERFWLEVSDLIDIDREDFLEKMQREGSTYMEIAQYIERSELDKWQAKELPINFHPQSWRYYPGGHSASHLIGFVGFDEDRRVGQYGLERQYEAVLDHRERDYRVNFFAEIFTNLAVGSSSSDQREGHVVITIDPNVQGRLENRLKELQQDTSGSLVGGIVMDPQTGAIRAMAAKPDFDPNNYNQSDPNWFSNPNVESLFEMGSIMKPLTLAAGLDAGVITPETEYYDTGRVRVDGYTIANFDGRGRGYIDMQRVLNDSVNTGVVYVMDELGSQKFADYMRQFGLAEKTGIDLPNEANNMIRSFDSPRRVEYATASFGQGIALTPIGTIRALSALANGGRVVNPYVAEAVDYNRGSREELIEPVADQSVITENTSQVITRMLVNTVDEALLHGEVKKDRYSIAAKTGTAQIASSDQRGYREDGFLHSFFGYFPAYDPEFIILLYVLEPQGYQYASQSLTHPFMDLTGFLINHHNIPPDR